MTYGSWTLIREVDPNGSHRRVLCECKCSRRRVLYLSALTNGQTRQCAKCGRESWRGKFKATVAEAEAKKRAMETSK